MVIGAEPSLRERLGAFSFSFALLFQEESPRERRLGEAALIRFPDGAGILSRLPRRYPAIAYGAVADMDEAFARGVADYLGDPWSLEELRARAERVLGLGILPVAGPCITLRGPVLSGPAGEVSLPAEQASLLRQLAIAEGAGLSRNVLRRHYWPSLAEDSRAVDISVSRIRGQLSVVSGGRECVQIRSVRGFGYALTVHDRLCESCG